jgi:hypothetical protein
VLDPFFREVGHRAGLRLRELQSDGGGGRAPAAPVTDTTKCKLEECN